MRRGAWRSQTFFGSHRLTLSALELTALVGGQEVLNTNAGFPQLGVFTKQPEALTNDFVVNLLDINTEWQNAEVGDHFFEGRARTTGEV